jgi:glycosyltransferase involved in cell wall biosynthesis
MSPADRSSLRLGVFLASLAGGGLERTMVTIAARLADRGHAVTLLPCRRKGRLAEALPPGLVLHELERGSALAGRVAALRSDPGALLPLARPFLLAAKPPGPIPYLRSLAAWLRDARPDGLIACMPQENIAALMARRLADTAATRVVVTEHNTLSATVRRARSMNHRALPPLIGRAYRQADAVVAVSAGVADDLAATTGLPRRLVTVVHNPVVPPDVDRRASEPVDHPWLQPGEPPVVLGVGRLVPQKGFPTLLRAFARVRRQRPARLVVLGEAADGRATAKRTAELQGLAAELGIADSVALPGYAANPFAWMARAGVFALSSTHEGFGNVLPEAMACGCPVVSTDCPSGPAEILEDGRWGRLVPVGDDRALAEAILTTLAESPDRAALRGRAAAFSVDAAIDRYEALLLRGPRVTMM